MPSRCRTRKNDKRADFIVDSGGGLEAARAAVEAIVAELEGRSGIRCVRSSSTPKRPGLDPNEDRIIEFGGIELVNRFPTGRNFHVYINPQGRQVHPEALAVHGITDASLADKPAFAGILDDLLAFLEGAHLIAHNANFDIGFLNAEFGAAWLST